MQQPDKRGEHKVYYINMLKRYFSRTDKVNMLIKGENNQLGQDSELEISSSAHDPIILRHSKRKQE